MNILLTGATGFLGSHLSRAFIERRWGVYHFERGDCICEELMGRYDTVVHCAGIYGRNGESAAEMIRTNTLLTVQLFEAAQKAGVKRFIYTNTALPSNLNWYAHSKHQAADWLQMLASKTEVINLKIQHMYGPGAGEGNFVTSIFKQCLANVPEINLTKGEQLRDFIFIEDLVSAIVTLLKLPASPRFQTIDVGCREFVSVKTLVETIAQMTNTGSQLNFGAVPYRPLEPMKMMSASLFQLTRYGWKPRVGLEDGLKRTLAALEG